MSWANPAAPNLSDFLQFVQYGMGIAPQYLPTAVPTPAAPTLVASAAGGSLPTGSVYVTLTYVSTSGETTASPESSMAVTGPDGSLAVASPLMANGAIAYNVYAAATSGAEALQNEAPVALGTIYTIAALSAGVAPPTTNGAGSPWPSYALAQAQNLVIQVPTIAGPDYTIAVYNCAGHILLSIAPDQPGRDFFSLSRAKFGLDKPSFGVSLSQSDQGTSSTLAVPDAIAQLTLSDLGFVKTPWGREYVAFNQDFGDIFGLT